MLLNWNGSKGAIEMGEKKMWMAGAVLLVLAAAVLMSVPAMATERFIDNGDNTVLDTETGLTWTIDANMAGQKTWDEAVAYCESLGYGWRLPTLGEVESLLDMVAVEPPMLPAGHPFVNVQSAQYWSSTSYEQDGTSYTWYVDLVDPALSNYQDKDATCYVWPVRQDL